MDLDMQTGNVILKASSSSHISGKLKAADIEADLSGASWVELEGSGVNADIKASSSSRVVLPDFALDNVNIELSGASKGDINVAGKLDIVLSSNSSLLYQGNPTLGDVKTTGASQLAKK